MSEHLVRQRSAATKAELAAELASDVYRHVGVAMERSPHVFALFLGIVVDLAMLHFAPVHKATSIEFRWARTAMNVWRGWWNDAAPEVDPKEFSLGQAARVQYDSLCTQEKQ
jgi:hypothetical protein